LAAASNGYAKDNAEQASRPSTIATVGDAVGAAAGAVGDAAGAAADAAGTAAGDAASSAAGTAGDAVGAVGRGLGNAAVAIGPSGSFGARSVFGPPADPYAYHPKAPAKPKKATKKAKKKKPTEEPREDVAEQGGDNANGAAAARVSCSDVLDDPAGYERALVQLCRSASR
jgi:hypothetical protein